MDNINKYRYLSLDITLQDHGYDYQDLKELMQEPFHTLYSTKVGFQWHPSVTGKDFIEIGIIFCAAIGTITGSILSEIGSDLYQWTKYSLKKVLTNKESFDESRINIAFKDINITIHTHRKEDIVLAMESIERIIEKAREKEDKEKYIDFEIEDIIEEKTKKE